MKDIKNKYFTTSHYKKFTSNILDAKITAKKLVNESGLTEKIYPTQRLDETTITAEAQYSINFAKSNKKNCLSLHYNGANSFFFVNAAKIY